MWPSTWPFSVDLVTRPNGGRLDPARVCSKRLGHGHPSDRSEANPQDPIGPRLSPILARSSWAAANGEFRRGTSQLSLIKFLGHPPGARLGPARLTMAGEKRLVLL